MGGCWGGGGNPKLHVEVVRARGGREGHYNGLVSGELGVHTNHQGQCASVSSSHQQTSLRRLTRRLFRCLPRSHLRRTKRKCVWVRSSCGRAPQGGGSAVGREAPNGVPTTVYTHQGQCASAGSSHLRTSPRRLTRRLFRFLL